MTAIEVALLLIGVVFIIGSFFMIEKLSPTELSRVAELSEDYIKGLYDYGYNVGMAFQLTDDLLDLTSSTDTIGKPAGNDIRQGIVTLPTIRALEVSPDKDELHSIVTDRDMTDEMLQRALDIVRATDGLDYTQQQVHRFLEAAVKALPEEMPADIRENYEMLASFIGGRKY